MYNVTIEGHCVPQRSTIWFAVFIVEFTVIFIINAPTIVAFTRSRHLRQRSTYLITNLTVSDLLVGAVTGPLTIYYPSAESGICFGFKEMIMETLSGIFPISSLANLSLIALERLHATVYPFRHCLIEKWFYFRIIICSWLLALILSSVVAVLCRCSSEAEGSYWFKTSVPFLTILLVIVCNVIITVNIKRNPRPHPSSAIASERKLSVTLLIVSVVSLLTIPPWVVYHRLPIQSTACRLSNTTEPFIFHSVTFLLYMNSIVNPVIYAIRLQEFREAVRELLRRKNSGSARVQPIELHEM